MKILIIQLAKLGDIIQSFPLINDLKKAYPGSEIYVLHSEVFSESLSLQDRIIPLPINLDLLSLYKEGRYYLKHNNESIALLNELSDYNFDLIINLNSTGIAKDIISQVKANEKRGFASENTIDMEFLDLIMSFMKSRKLASLNLADIYRSLHSKDFLPADWNKSSDISEQKGKVVIQLGSRNFKRNPGLKFYVDLANSLINQGYQITLSGVDSEKTLGEEFCKGINRPSYLLNMIGKTNLEELLSLISASDFLISGDTGTMHLGSLCNTPIIALFGGPAYPYETLAYSSKAYAFMPDYNTCNLYPCPEFFNCPNNFVCTEFDFKSLVKIILGDKQNPQLLHTFFDPIGQLLLRSTKQNTVEDLCTLAWRKLIASYFYHKTLDLSSCLVTQDLNDSLNANYIKQIKRELQLLTVFTEVNDMESISQNFQILTPIIIFNMIHKPKSLLIDFVYESFHKELL